METMNYDRIKNKSNAPMIMFITFILLGSVVVAYGLMNEKKPEVVGENNALVDVVSKDTEQAKDIEYAVKSVTRKNDKSDYKSNITLPEISVEGVELTDINEQIKNKFLNKYDALESEASGSLENDFTYKVTYKTYETKTQEKKILSIVFYETIVANSNDVFSDKMYGFTVDLTTKEVLSSEDAAPLVLDYSFRNKIKEQIKEYIVSKNIVKEEDYNYSYTALEEYYIEDNTFHIVFNPSEPFDSKHGIIDIEITK